ncbi:hypothetical protein BU16DRAFT_2822 [Lophium mytilinum]|uniref:Uncharacterized protein n=1 Tax=Lophium mytilinum TaxID=390894 RepID=A0A6A6RCX5_9PEZI|nr:hypothetical protein BU16DRAFT_2822 [Lophium mytilinum]
MQNEARSDAFLSSSSIYCAQTYSHDHALCNPANSSSNFGLPQITTTETGNSTQYESRRTQSTRHIVSNKGGESRYNEEEGHARGIDHPILRQKTEKTAENKLTDSPAEKHDRKSRQRKRRRKGTMEPENALFSRTQCRVRFCYYKV